MVVRIFGLLRILLSLGIFVILGMFFFILGIFLGKVLGIFLGKLFVRINERIV